MNFTNENSEVDSSDNLASALAGGEAEFVTTAPTKQVSRGALVMGGILLMCGAGMYFMYQRSGHHPAAAPETAAAATTINQFLSSGTDNVRQMKELLASTEKVVQQFLAYPGKAQVPVDRLLTNPFRLLLPKPSEQTAKQDEENHAEKLEKARIAVLTAAEKLELQSIIHGRRKGCLINNTLYAEGQKVDGFTVEAINPRSVVISQDEQKFELTMQD